MDIKDNIRKYIQSNLVLFDDEAEFSDEDDFFQLGFVNSLFAMKLLNYIETEFSISIKNEELSISNFNSVKNIVSLIESKIKGE